MAKQFSTDQITEVLNRNTATFYSYHRHILLLASSLMGILVSFHQPCTQNSYHPIVHYSWSVAICSIAAGILSSVIALYAEVLEANQLVLALREELYRQHHSGDSNAKPVFSKPKKSLRFFGAAACVAYMVAVVSLAVYGVIAFN